MASVLIASFIGSLFSGLVIIKRMAFISQGLSYSAFGGMALGFLLFPSLTEPDLTVYAIAFGYGLFAAFLIGYLNHKPGLSNDSALGIVFTGGMALGLLCLSLQGKNTVQIEHYLFGDLLSLTWKDLYFLNLAAILSLLFCFLFFRHIHAISLDPIYAKIMGLPVRFIHYVFIVFLAIIVLLLIKTMGLLLTSAFLVLPGTTAILFQLRMKTMIIASLFIGLLATGCGLGLSLCIDRIPASILIIGVQFGLLLLGLGYNRMAGER